MPAGGCNKGSVSCVWLKMLVKGGGGPSALRP